VPPEPTRVRRQLAAELARLRSLAGLTLRQLGGVADIPHARVWRIEQAAAIPDAGQAERWLSATTASDTIREQVMALVYAAHSETVPWSSSLTGVDHLQGVSAGREESARTLCTFEHAHLPGLLQTHDYAAALLAMFDLDQNVPAAAAARQRRQELLYRPERSFRFVITERLLTWVPSPTVSSTAQQHRLREIGELNAVSIRVLPDQHRRPMSGFVLHQQVEDGADFVAIELEHGEVILQDPDDVEVYRQLFDDLDAAAGPLP
jgi:transcriptional regulator with XRE-family HTH domain